MKNNPIRIMLVDDHKIVRESWKMLLENNPKFEIIADFNNGEEALEHIQKLAPDIMLVDINMSPMNGLQLTEKVIQLMPDVRILGLSVNNLPKYATRILELGGWGYLTKTSSLEEITHGILEVYNGRQYICEEVRKRMNPPQ
jgi:two-component system invasion response regulator UvrY